MVQDVWLRATFRENHKSNKRGTSACKLRKIWDSPAYIFFLVFALKGKPVQPTVKKKKKDFLFSSNITAGFHHFFSPAEPSCMQWKITVKYWVEESNRLDELLGFNTKHFLCVFSGLNPRHMEVRGRIGATAAGLHHVHSNVGSELHLWPTLQLTAMPDQGLNRHPHG